MTRRQTVWLIVALIVACVGALSWVALLQLKATSTVCGGPVCYAQMTIRDPRGLRPSMTLDVWGNSSLRRFTLQWHGDRSEATVVRGNTVLIVVDGAVESVDDYSHARDQLWDSITPQYGVTRASVYAAVAHGRVVAHEPSASAATPH